MKNALCCNNMIVPGRDALATHHKKKPCGASSLRRAKKMVRAALLSRALERSIIAAGGLNGRVRDGNGCHTPARGTNQKGWQPDGRKPEEAASARCKARISFAAPHASGTKPGTGGAWRPDRTANQKRYAQCLAALAHPPCQTGSLPVALRVLRPGRLIFGGAWRLDAFSAYPFASWLPGNALGRTTGTPEGARPRSSRTRGRSRQPSSARGG